MKSLHPLAVSFRGCGINNLSSMTILGPERLNHPCCGRRVYSRPRRRLHPMRPGRPLKREMAYPVTSRGRRWLEAVCKLPAVLSIGAIPGQIESVSCYCIAGIIEWRKRRYPGKRQHLFPPRRVGSTVRNPLASSFSEWKRWRCMRVIDSIHGVPSALSVTPLSVEAFAISIGLLMN
jgi:hypothetical protein